MKAKAAVLYGTNQPLQIEEIDVDEPQTGEVLIKTSVSGVCHSDLHFMEGKWQHPVPVVLGHESAGVVEKVGPDVTNVQPGDRVVIAFVQSCGACDRCVTGRPALCENTRSLQRRGRIHIGDQRLYQFSGMAAFAEYQLVSAKACVLVPSDVPMEVAALVGCSVMTGVGLNIIQGAKLAGASRIIAVDLLESKLAAAREFGATDVVDASQGDAAQQVKELTGGGVDYAFEAIGLLKTAEDCWAMVRRGGQAVIVGMLPKGEPLSLPDAGLAFLDEKGIIGSFYGSTRQTYDMPWLMELYRQKRLKIDELITRRYSLEEINEAFAALKGGEVNRSVVVLN